MNFAQTESPINQKEQKGQMLYLERYTPLETVAPSPAFSSQGSRWFLIHPAMVKAQWVKIKADSWITSLVNLHVVPWTLVGMQRMETRVKHNPETYRRICLAFTQKSEGICMCSKRDMNAPHSYHLLTTLSDCWPWGTILRKLWFSKWYSSSSPWIKRKLISSDCN